MKTSLIVLVAWVLFFTSCNNHTEFKKNGIPTQATITAKVEKRKSKYTKQHVFRVNFFTQPDKENPQPEPEKKKNKTPDEIINNLKIGKMGDYNTAEFVVNKTAFDKYTVGDKIDIYYLKNNPSKAILKEEVDK